MNKYSFIILSHNQIENVSALIKSIWEYMPARETEIIIVDDYSTDGTREYINFLIQQKQEIKLVNGADPFNFSKNVNIGCETAQYEHLIICNQDTLFNHTLNNLIKTIEEIKEITLIAPCTNLCGEELQYMTHEGNTKPLIIQTNEANFITFYLNKKVWTQHHLDENYPCGVEDIDYCWTLRKAGHKIGIYCGCFVHHKGGITSTPKGKELIKIGWEVFKNKWGTAGERRANK